MSADGVSIVVPDFNECECIEKTLQELLGIMRGLGRAFEILCVDDGSSDGTDEKLKTLKASIGELRVLRLEPNSGQSAAFGVGFKHAVHGIVVTIDADGQNDPANIPALLDGLNHADVCCGYRARRKDTLSKRLASRIGNGARNWLLGSDIIDTGCSLKAFRVERVRDLWMLEGMHRFLPNLCAMQGAVIHQIPVNHRSRELGISKYTNFGRFLKTVPDVLAVCWMKRRMKSFSAREIIR